MPSFSSNPARPPPPPQLALARKLLAAIVMRSKELAALDARAAADGFLDTDAVDDLLGLADL